MPVIRSDVLAVVSTPKGKQDTNLKNSGPSSSHAAGEHLSNHTAKTPWTQVSALQMG